MPAWLSQSLSLSTMTTEQILMRLLVATAYGACVAGIYRFSHGRHEPDSRTLIATLVLLSILIAMVSMVIGDNVARAFSLVGALSIVRFRTVVDDTRDTAFVIFAVIVGMAAGAGLMLVPLLAMPVVGAVAIGLARSERPAERRARESTLIIRLALERDAEELTGLLQKYLDDYRLIAVETARQGAALEMKYHVRPRDSSQMPCLVRELNQLEGVQGVELRF